MDSNIVWNHNIPDDTYHKFCQNVYSQNGEDGIIQALLNDMNLYYGTFCEFGSGDGITSSNTYNLIKTRNFTGMAIESDNERYLKCVENYKMYPNVSVHNGSVLYYSNEYNLDAWLKLGKLPVDLDVLSIDIDSDDYHVWSGLTDFHPKIVIFEVNSYRDPVFKELNGKPCNEYNVDLLKRLKPDRIAQGCSFICGIRLGLEKGYVPISFTGNIIFVRKDLIHQVKQIPYIISDDEYDYIHLYSNLSLWKNTWYTNMGLSLNKAIGEYYTKYKKKEINQEWLQKRYQEIMNNVNLY